MALDAELINLKSAGTYRFERDKSEISNDVMTIPNLRLVVGFSKMGPFNTVKLVTSPAQFIKLYGNIDRSLEKKGSFFHRSALVSLSAGPILCLNLLNLDPDRDQVVEKSFSVSADKTNKRSVTLPVQSLYNTDKFWFASDEAYLDAVNTILGNTSSPEDEWEKGILHFSNVGKKPVSVLVKKASDYASKGFQLTLNEWYGEGNVPEYLNGTSYVSDYLVEVYVVGGDFGPALKAQESKVISSVDLDDDALNNHGEELTVFDFDTQLAESDVDGVSAEYKRFGSDIIYQSYFDERGFIRGENDTNLMKFLNLPSVDLRAKYVGSLIPNFVDKLGRNMWIQKLVNDDTDTIGLICTENISLLEDVDLDQNFIDENIDIIGNHVFAMTHSDTAADVPFDFLGYRFTYKNDPEVVKAGDVEYTYSDVFDNSKKHPYKWNGGEGEEAWADSSYLIEGQKLYKEDGSDADSDMDVVTVDKIISGVKPLISEYVYVEPEDFFTDVRSTKSYIPRDNEVILPCGSNVVVGDYLLSDIYNDDEGRVHSRITRVVEVRNIYNGDAEIVDGKLTNPATKAGILVVCADKVCKEAWDDKDGIIIKVTPIDKVADRLHWVCLNGFQINKDAMPNGTNERQNEILDMLRETPNFESTTSNLFKSLIDRDYVQFRYLIDTFGLGIEPECKNVYTQLCKKRTSALAIVNCPSQLDFKKSLDPSFINKTGGVEVEYIATGGDRSKNPSFLFTLPTIENGASYGAYYYPYLRITDLSAPKSVPPAAYVSNLYIQKYSRGFAWSIVAGQKRGVISGNQVVGVEATLVHENRDWLEPMGINSIIWEQGVGVEVYANKTAKQTPVSALSSIHVRESAIYIQDGIETILRKYVFEFNTAQTRMEIKTLVDEFLENIKNNGGLYDFKTVMDTSNNTPEVIDNNMGVIDVYVEIVRGLEIIAQRLTILKTGAIAAGGFDE